MTKLSIFGDSILRGVYWCETENKHKAWHNPYIAKIEQQSNFSIKNHSQMGCTIERGRGLFDKALLRGLDCEYLLIEYGGNDSDFVWEDIAADPKTVQPPKTPLLRFEETLRGFINKARSLHMQPLLINLPPIHAKRYFEWLSAKLDGKAILSWLTDINAIYRHHELYSLAITKLAKSLSCPLIDVRSPLLQMRNLDEMIGQDGLHPTPKGHECIWDSIYKFFAQKQYITSGDM